MYNIFRTGRMRLFQVALVLGLTAALIPVSAMAETTYKRVYDYQTQQYVFVPTSSYQDTLRGRVQSSWQNPVVKQAAIGAGVGAVAGLLSDRSSMMRGAGIGALVGVGTGLIDNSRTLDNHPMARSALQGAAIGTGAAAISRKSGVKGAVVGAGAGAGLHYLKNYLLNQNY